MASHTDTRHSSVVGRHDLGTEVSSRILQPAGLDILTRIDGVRRAVPEVVRFPQRLSQTAFYMAAYPLMLLSRRMELRLLELFQKGYVKGTVTMSAGNESTAVGMTLPLRPGRDSVSLLHRDFAGHLILGASPRQLFSQYMANAESMTHAREGNCHHGDAARRRYPMISHLGKMPSVVVGSTWAARRQGEDVYGLAVIGDGGSSTGEIHETFNIASVHRVPVLFIIQNNHYSFSTPTSFQYRCKQLSDRAHGYGIPGKTIDGLDAWGVYTTICDAMEEMQANPLPHVIECMTTRLYGHAAYDKGDYVPADRLQQWRDQDPVTTTRQKLLDVCGLSDAEVKHIENAVEEEVQTSVNAALKVERPDPAQNRATVFAAPQTTTVKPYSAPVVKNGDAVGRALDYVLENDPQAFFFGLDIGTYGSAFKTCKGLIDRHGPERVMDMPIAESSMAGFALGASQIGATPIMEFQFADFSTEATTQLGLNAGTWHFRAGRPAPMLIRLPCGGGLTMGPFHSGEFEGLWSRFPGLKLLYPATAQETFEALVAGFYDPNPCLVFEHKGLYWSKSGKIEFDGNLEAVWRSRRYTEGTDLTLVAFGAMVHESLAVAQRSSHSIEVWNPFVLQPLDIGPIVESVVRTGRLLVVQECSETQGLGDQIISLVCREAVRALKCRPVLVSAPNLPIPFAPELETLHRPSAQRIEAAVDQIVQDNA